MVNHYAEFVNVCDYIEINKSKYNGHFKLDLSHDQYLSDISIDIDYYLKYASVRDAYILDSMHVCLLWKCPVVESKVNDSNIFPAAMLFK